MKIKKILISSLIPIVIIVIAGTFLLNSDQNQHKDCGQDSECLEKAIRECEEGVRGINKTSTINGFKTKTVMEQQILGVENNLCKVHRIAHISVVMWIPYKIGPFEIPYRRKEKGTVEFYHYYELGSDSNIVIIKEIK